ncbi:hypothetical protein Pmani_021025 [Petrolisthes manimaculis]|uniref:Ig-like domain-containing protein n=1 Tax=Petrolisthes manimaculis TaxID=1843537 RepID=A0AAE1PH83_9EUCA|nr:hypothetical protein Pmani_021025 [Petrolisthes manimaculis]
MMVMGFGGDVNKLDNWRDPPGQPTITGYESGEVLLAGERRTLTCRVLGGNPRPWVLWYRDGRLLDDTTTHDGGGVFNSYEVAVTAEEDGAVYECSVTNDLLGNPFTANVTLTVYCEYLIRITLHDNTTNEGNADANPGGPRCHTRLKGNRETRL